MIYKVFTFILLLLSVGCGHSQEKLSIKEQEKLNNLNAAETVQAYFSSGNPAVEYYLSSEKERALLNSPNLVQETDRIGGVDNIVITERPSDSKDEKAFMVQYKSPRTNSEGEAPGPRTFFVYVIQEPKTKLWKIDEVGTGPK
jgi:hypothetical protein